MPQKYSNEQRDRILAAAKKFLEDNGVDVDQLEKKAAQERSARRRFSTPLAEGVTSRFQTIPEGNEEQRAVGRYGGGVAPRCQARSRRSGFQQCGSIAVAGFRTCRVHGAKASGTKTEAGIKKSAQHLYLHGQETREIRRKRSEASKERWELERQMIAKGMATPEVRGPRPGKDGRIDTAGYLKRRKKTEEMAQSRSRRVLNKS